MARHSPTKVIRNISGSFLQRYFDGCGLLGNFDWTGYELGDPKSIIESLDALSSDDHTTVDTDVYTVNELATDGGSKLIYEEAAFWKRP